MNKKILLLSAHPSQHRSKVNNPLFEAMGTDKHGIHSVAKSEWTPPKGYADKFLE